ncbi:MAG TPA: hypothetical protein PLW67_10410 [Prolixibacteraceae bacterium]|nr:hypothetical protein [Prolixibacteraceae bacterium]
MKKKILLGITVFFLLFPGKGKAGTFTLKSEGAEVEVIPFSTYHYVSFDLERETEYTLVTGIKVTSAEIEPASLRIPFTLNGNNLIFRLDKPGYFLIRLNDSVKVFVFAEKPDRFLPGENSVDITEKYHPDTSGRVNETERIQQALDEISGR